jgi:hypothetical protein
MAHDLGALHRAHRVADADAARPAQGAHLGKPSAIETLSHGAQDLDAGHARCGTALMDELRDGRRVHHRVRIRRAAQGGDARRYRGTSLAGNGPLVLLAGLAQVGTQVHQARANHTARGLQDPSRFEVPWGRSYPGDTPVGHMQIRDSVDAVPGIDDPAAPHGELHQPSSPLLAWLPRVMDMTAMRTAMP